VDITMHEANTDEAADTAAIVTGTPIPKAPVSNNDPTRDISNRERWTRGTALAVAIVALVALALATVLVALL
jgi:hypothetical protein